MAKSFSATQRPSIDAQTIKSDAKTAGLILLIV
jgi:hypothetical protein